MFEKNSSYYSHTHPSVCNFVTWDQFLNKVHWNVFSKFIIVNAQHMNFRHATVNVSLVTAALGSVVMP